MISLTLSDGSARVNQYGRENFLRGHWWQCQCSVTWEMRMMKPLAVSSTCPTTPAFPGCAVMWSTAECASPAPVYGSHAIHTYSRRWLQLTSITRKLVIFLKICFASVHTNLTERWLLLNLYSSNCQANVLKRMCSQHIEFQYFWRTLRMMKKIK